MNKRFLIGLCLGTLGWACSNPSVEADILIRNGEVYNGLDHESSKIAIAVKDDKIVFMGKENSVNIRAKKTIDASGMIVAPGFIDPHTHADRDLNQKETAHNLPFLMQGITTVVGGNDGDSFFPAKNYVATYEKNGIGTNAILLVGHETIRKEIIGLSDREATADEIHKMKVLLKREMEDAGNYGMSTGLFYAPGSYANTEEVVALAKTCADNGGIYDTHLRDESTYTVGLVAAVNEAIEIGRQANLPIHISHIKCLGVDVWKQSDSIINLINSARNEGLNITANQYPYDASATGLKAATAPKWAQSGGKDSLLYRYNHPMLRTRVLADTKNNIRRRGGPESLLIVKCENPDFLNKTLGQIASALKCAPENAVYEILKTPGIVRVASFNMSAYDIRNYMKQDWVTTGSDGNTGHPRKYGSFPRKYHKYVKQEKIIDLPTFIHNSSLKTAHIFGIPKRGKLEPGFYADIIVFDPENYMDKADYKDAFQYAQGLQYALVNGKIAIDQGVYTGGLYGQVLKKR
jgi:N-acyl-D-aspartate/D-glutamate deacylase